MMQDFEVTKFSSLIKSVLPLLVLTQFCQTLLDVKNPKCVFEVGANLTKRLTDQYSGTKEDIINDLTDYFIYLNTAFRVEKESHPKGKEMLQKLTARGGPPFLKVAIKDEWLETKYEMGPVEVDHVKDVIEDIDKLWKDIKNGTLVPPEFENY